MAFVGSLSGSGGASNTINVTGSMIIANPGTGGTFPSFPGTDTVFFVSGAIDGKAAGSRTVSVFGGDTVVSGSLTVGTGSITITSNEIQFLGGAAKIISGSGGLTFFDSGNSGGVTLTSITAGAGGGDVDGPSSATDNAIARFDQTTGKIIQNSLVTISDLATDTVTIVGDATATTIELFNTNATTVNFAGGASSATNIGNASGLTTIAGKIKVSGNEIQSSTGELALAFTGSNVIIPGDLTVRGTTVTVDATTLTIEDPVIGLGFTSGSTAPDVGDRGFIGGMNLGGNVALFWDNTDSTFTSVRTSTSAGNSPVDITSYTPFRASSFEVGGTPGTAVSAISAYISSSDARNIIINHSASTTFTEAGIPLIEIGDYQGNSGEGQIKGVTTGNALAPLWLSGSAIKTGAEYFTFAGLDGIEAGRMTPITPGGGIRFEARDGGVNSRAMVISGSLTKIGANTGVIQFEAAGAAFLTASVAGVAVSLTAGTGISTAFLLNGTTTTLNFAQQATTINMGNVAGTNNISGVSRFAQGLSGSLTRLTDGSSYIVAGANINVVSASNGSITISSIGGGDVTGPGSSTANAIARFNGLTGKVIQNTAGVTIDGSNNVVTSGSYSVKDGAGNQVVSITSSGVISGSSNIAAGGGLTVGLAVTAGGGASFGGGFGSSGTTISGGGDISTNGTLLVQGATTLSGSVILGDTTGDDLTFNGYAASHLVPKTTNLFDLGTPDLRWRNMYTGDLHLKNERGDWTVIEEEDFLTLTNNKSGKRYKFVLEEI